MGTTGGGAGELATGRRGKVGGNWPRLLDAGERVVVAREFSAAVMLAVDPAVFVPAADPGDTVPAGYGKLLAELHTGRCGWWLAVIRGWAALGLPGLAHALLTHTVHLVGTGLRADWAELSELAALAQEPALRPSEPVPVPAPVAPLGVEGPESKRERLAALFDGEDDLSYGESPATDPEGVERRLLRDLAGPYLARGDVWYGLGEYRIIVEQLLTIVGDEGLSGWLESEVRTELVWCGRALLRLGDPTTAYACFYLASALTDEAAVGPGPDPMRPNRVDPVLAAAWRYRRMLVEEHSRLGSDRELHRAFAHGLRIGDWMMQRGLEARLPELVSLLDGRVLRHRLPVAARQLRTVGRRSGWFLPALLADAELLREVPPPVVPASAPTRVAVPPASGDPFRPPARLTGHPDAPPGVPLRVGLADRGGVASLRIGPGVRCRLIGTPVTEARIGAWGNTLSRQGWPVVWIRETPVGAVPRGWHRLRPQSDGQGQAGWWLEELDRAPALRDLLAQCLLARLPHCADPAAEAVVRAIVYAVGLRTRRAYASDDADASRTHAVAMVSERAGLTFHHTGDLRRAALLLDRALGVVSILRRAVAMTFQRPDFSVEPLGSAGRVLADLPTDAVEAPVAATLLLGSIVDTVGAIGSVPKATGDRDWSDFELDVVPRPDEARLEELAALVSSAREPDPPPERSAPAAGGTPPDDDNPWIRTGVVPTTGVTGPVCVLFTGGPGPVLDQLQRLFATAEFAPHVLVAATADTDPRAIGDCTGYTELFAGGLTPAAYGTLAVAAGVTVADALVDGIGAHGGIRVTAGRGRSHVSRCVVWPVNGTQGGG
ncbi:MULTISPECIES: hypothetical protein [unclassified Micromonospora]|uniref:hypothetical protein n=1 Tax=unclassified Micromonospora TaxID=2617518 RepID=UPI001C5F0EDC|nr:hypothetical protein [Micromonospora sp. RL09-050-HVF-A]MBW4700908.1 hypothetical protein [Micromonospora sp. RL09-050-HVF-A]